MPHTFFNSSQLNLENNKRKKSPLDVLLVANANNI